MKLEELPIDWSQIRLPEDRYQIAGRTDDLVQPDTTLDALIHSKTRILNTKLEAVGSAVQQRLQIRHHNLERIADDKERLTDMLQRLNVGATYNLRQHSEKRVLYEKMFTLEQERRQQDVDCWRDVVLVMRDFLTFWDEHEQAKARGTFLNDVG